MLYLLNDIVVDVLLSAIQILQIPKTKRDKVDNDDDDDAVVVKADARMLALRL